MRTLGFDTSNYTTSVAAFNGVSGENCSRLLDVRPGELGLRQSDALFAHVKRLPEMTDELFAALPKDTIRAVGASTRPRAVDGSYMPCFLAGSSQAQTLARILDVPFYAFSHRQEKASRTVRRICFLCRFSRYPISRGISRRRCGRRDGWS